MSVVVEVHRFSHGYACWHVAWVSDANGDASVWLDDVRWPQPRGIVDRVTTRPGPATPSDNYDLRFYTERNASIWAVTNRDSAIAEISWPSFSVGLYSRLDFVLAEPLCVCIENAGDTKCGEIGLWVVTLQALERLRR